MKIEIYLGKEDEEGEDEMPSKPTAFHKKVAKMLAKEQGRKKISDMDLKKAMHLDEEEDS